jgi:hypothetical protein
MGVLASSSKAIVQAPADFILRDRGFRNMIFLSGLG